MEIIHRETINLEQVADLCELGITRFTPEPRDHSLWHISNLLISAHRITKGKVEYYENDDLPSGLMSMGRIWETVVDCYMTDYAKRHDGVFVPDVVYEMDGIAGSLDGLMMLSTVDLPIVCETKWRFSISEDIPLDHLQQIRAYCHLAETRLACYVSGHVSTTPPIVQAFLRLIKFEPMSIAETWQGLLNTKRYLKSLGLGPGKGGKNAKSN